MHLIFVSLIFSFVGLAKTFLHLSIGTLSHFALFEQIFYINVFIDFLNTEMMRNIDDNTAQMTISFHPGIDNLTNSDKN